MRKFIKKTAAVVLAGAMVIMCLSKEGIMFAQAEEDSQKVEYIYDDYRLGYGKADEIALMKNGKFSEDVGENAVLLLVDKNGKKTEIPSINADGERIFTSVEVATSPISAIFNMLKIQRGNETAFLRYDGTYFGGDEKYYTGNTVRMITDYAVKISTEAGKDTYGNNIYNYKLLTETGKTISFEDGGEFSTRFLGECLICYQDGKNTFYVYNKTTDEIKEIEGQFGGYGGIGFLVISKDGQMKEMYDEFMNSTGILFPANLEVDVSNWSKGYIYVRSTAGNINIIDKDGVWWNTTGESLNKVQMLDIEKGYYYAEIKKENKSEKKYILSKDGGISVDIDNALTGNINELFEQLKQDLKIEEECSTGYSEDIKVLDNGDLAVKLYNIHINNLQIDSEYFFILLKDKQYAQVKRFEANRIESSSGYILMYTSKENRESTANVISNLVLYDNDYQKIKEIQLPPGIENVSSVIAGRDNQPFTLVCRINEETKYYTVKEDGSIEESKQDKAESIYSTPSGYYSYRMSEGRIEVYNKLGIMIYSGEYNQERTCLPPAESEDGSICLISTNGNHEREEWEYVVVDYNGAVCFDSDDYKLILPLFYTEEENLQTIIYREEEGNRKYGFLSVDIKKKMLASEENVFVEFEAGQINNNVTLHAGLLQKSDEKYTKIDILNKILNSDVKPEDVKAAPYEITLTDKQQRPVQLDDTVTVKILCPDTYNGENCKVYYADEKGRLTDMKAVYKDGYLCFKTTHFSVYLVTETELIEEISLIYGDINNDGDVNSKDAVLLKKHLAGYTGLDIDKTAADVNADGVIDSKDAVRRYRQQRRRKAFKASCGI